MGFPTKAPHFEHLWVPEKLVESNDDEHWWTIIIKACAFDGYIHVYSGKVGVLHNALLRVSRWEAVNGWTLPSPNMAGKSPVYRWFFQLFPALSFQLDGGFQPATFEKDRPHRSRRCGWGDPFPPVSIYTLRGGWPKRRAGHGEATGRDASQRGETAGLLVQFVIKRFVTIYSIVNVTIYSIVNVTIYSSTMDPMGKN